MSEPLTDRVRELRSWAESRIRQCQEQEQKFGTAWTLRTKHTQGPPQALVEAWTERRALQAALNILAPEASDG